MIPVAKWRPWRSLLGACFACKEIFISHCSHTGPKYLLYAHRDQIVRAILKCGRNSEHTKNIHNYFVVIYKPRGHFCLLPPALSTVYWGSGGNFVVCTYTLHGPKNATRHFAKNLSGLKFPNSQIPIQI